MSVYIAVAFTLPAPCIRVYASVYLSMLSYSKRGESVYTPIAIIKQSTTNSDLIDCDPILSFGYKVSKEGVRKFLRKKKLSLGKYFFSILIVVYRQSKE